MARFTGSIALAGAAALAAGSAFPGIAFAQDGGGDYLVEFGDGKMSVQDARSRGVLLDQDARKFTIAKLDGALSPQVDVSVVGDGYDIRYSFTNQTSSEKPLPDLRVGPILLGDEVRYQDMRRSCEAIETDAQSHKTPGHNYPVNMYSPVWIIRNAEHAAGVSLQYPLLEYRHDVRMYMKYHPNSGGWLVDIKMSANDDSLEHSAMVPAGETWEYTVSVRFTPEADEWVRTLVPYRDYFRAMYGGVQYDRKVTPVNAVGLSMEGELSDENPYGFIRDRIRPDQVGYGPFIDFTLARKGWPEFMVITPTGLYRHNVHMNYPFQFTSQWNKEPMFGSALDPDAGFPKFAAEGRTLGLWWGRAAQVATSWDANTNHTLDPDDPADVAAALAELDLAVQAGAQVIGLDTYGYRAIPTWDSYRWLETMQQRHPHLRFVLEPMPCDIMHTKAAGWLRGFNDEFPVDSLEELNFIKGPHYLADFLLPGHETWAAWRYKGHRLYLGINPTQEMVEADGMRFAEWGYRPMLYTDFELRNFNDLRGGMTAAESWKYTVPPDLQLDDDGGSSGSRSGGRNARGGSSSEGGVVSQGGGTRPTLRSISPEEARGALQRSRKHLAPKTASGNE